MYSVFAFLITLAEMLIVLVSYALKSQNIFYTSLIYGSPFYLLMNLFTANSALWDKSPLYLSLLAFHAGKYFILFRSQLEEEHMLLRYAAIAFEAAYLCISGYYLN